MTQIASLTPKLAAVGENIGQELGAKMVKDFQDKYPSENKWFFVGSNIIDQILAQPDCVGIRFYNALDENGQKTLVLVGIDIQENIIIEYSSISNNGQLTQHKGIVADRINRPKTDGTSTSISYEWWSQ